MKTPLIAVAALAALVSLTSVVRAADDDYAKTHPFKTADKNGDKMISQDEFVAFVADKMDAAKAKAEFAKLDVNHDGYLDRQEFRARLKEPRANKKKKHKAED